MISYCFYPGPSPFQYINDLLIYLFEKFIDKYPAYFIEKSYIFQDLYTLSKLVFDLVNDYSKDEMARLVISQLKDALNERYTLLSEQNEKIIDILKERLPLPKEGNIANFKDKGTINLYKYSLTDMYRFEDKLQKKHPNNNNVKPKIRQQLQFLRDKGIIEFLGNGHYRKVK